MGLSYTEVIATCGQPYFDPKAKEGWKDERTDGPLAISYTGPAGQTYVVHFRADKVVKVERFFK